MRLIGMLDSPYVRRVAISLNAMGVAFAHEPLSVFRDFDRFAAINPAVKAPSLIADDGTVLMESTLILQYLDRLVPPDRRLIPEDPAALLVSQRRIGLALTACEKAVQIVYETSLRPAEKQHQPWLDRVERQLLATCDLLEAGYAGADGRLSGGRMMQSEITSAVIWRFTQHVLPKLVPEARYPLLRASSQRAEATPEFMAAPIG